MLEEVKPQEKTTQQELDEITKVVGQLFFDWGRLHYEAQVNTQQINDISIKVHNLNEQAKKLQKQLAKEKATEAIAEVKLNKEPAMGGDIA